MSRRPRGPALALIAGVALMASCSKTVKHPISAVEVVGATARDNGLLGLSRDGIEARFREALRHSGRFELLEAAERPREGATVLTLQLDLPFTRESRKEGREGTWAEVGANLTIRRRVGGTTLRYEVTGLGEVQVEGEGDRRRAMQAALESAIAQVTESAHLQLLALTKSDRDLLEDLKEGTGPVQEFALRALSERQNPAVAEVLIDRLKAGTDLDRIRQAMGVLAEMRERRAVKPLIDLTRGRDPVFVREVLFALAQIGGEEARAYLFTMAQGHDDPVLRESAQQALNELEARARTGAGAPQGGAK